MGGWRKLKSTPIAQPTTPTIPPWVDVALSHAHILGVGIKETRISYSCVAVHWLSMLQDDERRMYFT